MRGPIHEHLRSVAVGASHDIAELIEAAPLVAAFKAATERSGPPFTIPGHKRRAAALSPTLGRMLDADIPLYGGLDTPKLTGHVLTDAERLAAEAWGGSWCRFSTGGSTHANQALTMAVGRPGDTILVSRALHRSTLSGLVLAGLRPVWLPVEVEPRFAISTGVSVNTMRRALREHPDAVAVFLVEPGYSGVQSPELADVIATARDADVTVIVDQAWGAHFGFHPAYPRSALQLGADAMVMSGHKATVAFSQGAYIVTAGDRLAPDLLERCFETCATTSPSGAILASLDANRALLASAAGCRLLDELATRVEHARERLRAANFDIPGPDAFPEQCFDPAKLVIRTRACGPDGLEVEQSLAAAGIAVEMADRATIIPIVGLTDDDASVEALLDVLTSAASARPPVSRRAAAQRSPSSWALPHAGIGHSAMTPRDAFYAARQRVPLDASVGHISAELVAPYPPGVPFLIPGERIDAQAVAALRQCALSGARIAYSADPSLRTVLVVKTPPNEPL